MKIKRIDGTYCNCLICKGGLQKYEDDMKREAIMSDKSMREILEQFQTDYQHSLGSASWKNDVEYAQKKALSSIREVFKQEKCKFCEDKLLIKEAADEEITRLKEEITKLSHSAQFRRVELQQEEIENHKTTAAHLEMDVMTLRKELIMFKGEVAHLKKELQEAWDDNITHKDANLKYRNTISRLEVERAEFKHQLEKREKELPTYPCADCGMLRTEAEGGTTFTVCDKCWDKHYKQK